MRGGVRGWRLEAFECHNRGHEDTDKDGCESKLVQAEPARHPGHPGGDRFQSTEEAIPRIARSAIGNQGPRNKTQEAEFREQM